MLDSHLNIALKEWAVVQRSLLEQHQIMMLRKGGIAEENGDFDLRASQFVILPTYIHEDERQGDLQPCFEDWLADETRSRPNPDTVKIECVCTVADVIRVDDRDRLLKLMPQHIWSRQFIDGRYDWEPYKQVAVLLVRAYRLNEPIILPNRSYYGGCRSWITLETAISTESATPAISSDTKFERRLELTKEILQGK